MPNNKNPSSASASIFTWEHDPGLGNSIDGGKKIETLPGNHITALPFTINFKQAPPAGKYDTNTREFRYWVAVEALNRACTYWHQILPDIKWYYQQPLAIDLDAGDELNAFYNRKGLLFYHAQANTRTIYTGESPDVLCHELGHAVLDAIKPQLWDVASLEADAFHEAFGDISTILCALQLKSLRQTLLDETGGVIYTSSRLSRLAEQLAYAIRLRTPAKVDPDCLRNAVNSFIYQNPLSLPSNAPASTLSAAPHSFSRVFTSAFFEGLAKMFALHPSKNEASLLQVSQDMGKILTNAIKASDLVPGYFTEISLRMLAAAKNNILDYTAVLKNVFIKHGLLSPGDSFKIDKAVSYFRRKGFDASSFLNESNNDFKDSGDTTKISLSITGYNLGVDQIEVFVPERPTLLISDTSQHVKGMAMATMDALTPEYAAKLFLDNLIRRGRLKTNQRPIDASLALGITAEEEQFTKYTHELRQEENKYVLRRIRVDCWENHC